jgi:hypothetical protein
MKTPRQCSGDAPKGFTWVRKVSISATTDIQSDAGLPTVRTCGGIGRLAELAIDLSGELAGFSFSSRPRAAKAGIPDR